MKRLHAAALFLALGLAPLSALRAEAPRVPGARDRQRTELKLTPRQREALARLEQESRASSSRLQSRLRHLRRDLERQYAQPRLDIQRVRVLHREINANQARLLEERLATQRRLREILTAEQFLTLQRILKEDDDDD